MTFAMLILVSIFAVPVGGVALFQYLRAEEHRKSQSTIWAAIAHQRGGRLLPAQGSFGHHTLHLPGPGQGVTVAVANGIVVDAAVARELVNPGGWHTQVAVPCMVPCPSYVVHGHHPERASRVLSAAAMQWFPYLGSDATIACGGRLVTVVMPGVVLDGNRIQGAIELAIDLASRGPAQV